MSVHLRSNGSASRNVFISSDIPQGTAIHRAPSETRTIPSQPISKPVQKSECLPQKQNTRSKQQMQHQAKNTAQSFQKYDNDSDGSPSSQAQQRVSLESIVRINSSNQQQREIYPHSSELQEDTSVNDGVSALPSAPVHLQETVDNFLTAPAIGGYNQNAVHGSGSDNQICSPVYPLTSQPPQKQAMMQQLADIGVEMQDDMGNINTQRSQSMCGCPSMPGQSSPHNLGYCPNIPKSQSGLTNRDGCVQNSQKMQQLFSDQDQQSGMRYGLIHQPESRKQTQSKQPLQQQSGMNYSSMSPQLHLVSAQQQPPYYMPMSQYNSQSMLVVQLDYQRQPILRSSPLQLSSQPQKPHNNTVSSPVLFERGTWDEYMQFQAREFAKPQNNEFDCMRQRQQHQPKQYQTVKKRRRRTSQKELEILENHFKINTLPSYIQREQLARDTGMTPRSVQVWFQNKRQSLKKKNLTVTNTNNSDPGYYPQDRHGNAPVQSDKKVSIGLNENVQNHQDSKKLQSPPAETPPQITQTRDQIRQQEESGTPTSMQGPPPSKSCYQPRQQENSGHSTPCQTFMHSPPAMKDQTMKLHISRDNDDGGYHAGEFSHQQTNGMHLARNSPSDEQYSIYSVPMPMQSQPPDIQSRDVMFPQNQDPMVTLAALAAMASDQIDNF